MQGYVDIHKQNFLLYQYQLLLNRSNIRRKYQLVLMLDSCISEILQDCFFPLLLLTYQLFQSITIPLQKLLTAINKTTKVQIDFSSRENKKTPDEINELGMAFNRMIDKLAQSKKEIDDHTRKLEARVKERTTELYNDKQALLESERHLKAVWDSTPTGLMVIDNPTHCLHLRFE